MKPWPIVFLILAVWNGMGMVSGPLDRQTGFCAFCCGMSVAAFGLTLGGRK